MQTITFLTRSRTSPMLWLRTAATALTLVLAISACGGSSSPGQPGAASITTQPIDQSVVVGSTATFVVVAGSATGYQWQVSIDSGSSFSDISSATTASYTTAATILADSGTQYRVVVSGAGNSVTSSAVTLTVTTVPVAPGISVHPADRTVTAGQDAAFTVTASGTSLSYQWQRSTNGGISFTNVAAATGATLNLPAVSLSDDGQQFHVIVSNSTGTITSNAATLTVNAAVVAPAFTTQPADITIIEGQNAQFTVAANGTPAPTLQWQLSTNSGGAWSNIIGETGTIFNVAAAALANNGRQFRAVASNSAGTVNSNAATLTVTAAAGAKVFGTAALIETGATAAGRPQIAFAPNGDALAIWMQQSDGLYMNIWANYYTSATNTWGIAELIETGAGDAWDPQIAMDANGNALAVWYQDGDATDAVRYDIVANRYTAGSGWGTATLIETDDAASAMNPQIAIDANGNGLAVWLQGDGTASHIRSNRYTAGTGWGTAVLIETATPGASATPQIAFDINNNALAVWSRYDGTGTIMANRYTAGSGWGSAGVIGGAGGNPRIAIDAGGNALAVWSQSGSIWSIRYTAGSGWGTAALIEWTGGDAGDPQIVFDASGNALAVWQQDSGFSTNMRIWSNRYTVGSGWGGFPAIIQTDISGGATANAVTPRIAIDADGNALAVWVQPDGASDNTPDVWVNRYTAGSGWGTTANLGQVRINTPGAAGQSAGMPQIAIDGSGNALVVWTQSDGVNDSIWYNRYQ